MTNSTTRIQASDLIQFTQAVYESAGVPAEDAYLAADTLVQADLWGHQSHGLLRLAWYYARLRSGAMKSITNTSLVVDSNAIAVLDGHDGVGHTERHHRQLADEHIFIRPSTDAAMLIAMAYVIVTENLFGDILSDEAAMLTGSPEPTMGSGGDMRSATSSSGAALPVTSASSRSCSASTTTATRTRGTTRAGTACPARRTTPRISSPSRRA